MLRHKNAHCVTRTGTALRQGNTCCYVKWILPATSGEHVLLRREKISCYVKRYVLLSQANWWKRTLAATSRKHVHYIKRTRTTMSREHVLLRQESTCCNVMITRRQLLRHANLLRHASTCCCGIRTRAVARQENMRCCVIGTRTVVYTGTRAASREPVAP